MKEFIINKSINTICKQDPYISKEKKEILIYGLEALYITISKFIIISIIAASLGIFKEHLIYLLIYKSTGILRQGKRRGLFKGSRKQFL